MKLIIILLIILGWSIFIISAIYAVEYYDKDEDPVPTPSEDETEYDFFYRD